MKFSFSKIKSAFQKNDVEKAISNATYLEEIKANIKDKPFAEAEQNIVFAGLNELAGYLYFRVIVVGKFKIKTFTGVQLNLKLSTTEMHLNSDMNELTSDFGPIKNSFITPIDFEVSKKQIEILNNSKIESLQVICKKKEVTFIKTQS